MIAVVLKLAPLLLALIMLGMGMGLEPADFKRVLQAPRAAAVGLFGQVICLPAIAWLLVLVLPLEPEIAVGVVILAAAPGGPGSNLVALLAKGDAALSVSLTAVNSLLGLVTVPLATALATRTFLGASQQLAPAGLAGIAVGVCLLTLVPVGIGMALRRWRPWLADSAAKPVRIGAVLVLLLLVAGVVAEQGHRLPELLAQAGVVDVALCAIAMGVGGALAYVAGLSVAQRRTVVIEVGVQNGALALLVTQQMLQNTTMTVPVLLYSPVMLTASFLMIAWGNRSAT